MQSNPPQLATTGATSLDIHRLERPPSQPGSATTSGQLERQVVLLGLHDPLWSADRGSWASRAASLFAPHEAQPLADPRLEALRRYTVLYRSGLMGNLDEALLDDGLSAEDLAAARSIVDSCRCGHP